MRPNRTLRSIKARQRAGRSADSPGLVILLKTKAHLRCAPLVLLVRAVVAGAVAEVSPASPRGLCVRDGVVLLEGKPFRGIGANCFSLFSRLLHQPDDTSACWNLPKIHASRQCAGFPR